MAPPPPPPPPPPICFPFSSSKPKRRLSWSSSNRSLPLPPGPQDAKAVRHPAYSPTSTFTSQADGLTFHSDSEKYDELPSVLPVLQKGEKGRPKLGRSNTMTGTKKSTASSRWGYGWGVGKKDKQKEVEEEAEMSEKTGSQVNLPLYQPVVRRDTRSTQASRSTQKTQDTQRTQTSQGGSKLSGLTRGDTQRTTSSRSTAPKPRPPLMGHELYPQDSTATLVGSAFERKINDTDSIRAKPDTTDRLAEMRRLMNKDNLDY